MIARHPAATRRFTPWKNGGGETAEIVCQPEGAGFDDFQWRISTARVAASGPFSIFPGVARVLTVLEGGPMRLRFGDGAEVLADMARGPLAFRGDIACAAELTGPPVLDLNVMTRAPFTGRVYRNGAPPDDAPPDDTRPEARYLLALADLPDAGMRRLDLVRIDPQGPLPDGAAWVIDILRL